MKSRFIIFFIVLFGSLFVANAQAGQAIAELGALTGIAVAEKTVSLASAAASTAEGAIPTTPSVTWWATIMGQISDFWESLDNDGTMIASLAEANSFQSGLYSSLHLLSASPEIYDLAEIATFYSTGYQDIISYYQHLFDNGFIDYSQLSSFGNRLLSDVRRAGTDLAFIYDYLLNPATKLTPAERQRFLRDYNTRLKTRWWKMSSEYEMARDSAYQNQINEAFATFLRDSVGPGEGIAAAMSNYTREDWEKRFDQALSDPQKTKGKTINNNEINKTSDKIKKSNSTIVRLVELIIIVLSALYIPYNLWRVNSHERQSNDALIRIIIGLLFGFLMLLFLQVIIK